jgi:hypothetical protein
MTLSVERILEQGTIVITLDQSIKPDIGLVINGELVQKLIIK